MAQPLNPQALLDAMEAFMPTLEAICKYLCAHNCDPLADELEEAFMDARDMLAEEHDDAD